MHKVTLRGLLSGRPDDAAEILRDFAPMEAYDFTCGHLHVQTYQTLVRLVLQGREVIVDVEDQRALNALAGHFWVEPRRIPTEKVAADFGGAQPLTVYDDDLGSNLPVYDVEKDQTLVCLGSDPIRRVLRLATYSTPGTHRRKVQIDLRTGLATAGRALD